MIINVVLQCTYKSWKFILEEYFCTRKTTRIACACHSCTGSAKKRIHTLKKENSIINYCKSTIYFRQHNNMIYTL